MITAELTIMLPLSPHTTSDQTSCMNTAMKHKHRMRICVYANRFIYADFHNKKRTMYMFVFVTIFFTASNLLRSNKNIKKNGYSGRRSFPL